MLGRTLVLCQSRADQSSHAPPSSCSFTNQLITASFSIAMFLPSPMRRRESLWFIYNAFPHSHSITLSLTHPPTHYAVCPFPYNKAHSLNYQIRRVLTSNSKSARFLFHRSCRVSCIMTNLPCSSEAERSSQQIYVLYSWVLQAVRLWRNRPRRVTEYHCESLYSFQFATVITVLVGNESSTVSPGWKIWRLATSAGLYSSTKSVPSLVS